MCVCYVSYLCGESTCASDYFELLLLHLFGPFSLYLTSLTLYPVGVQKFSKTLFMLMSIRAVVQQISGRSQVETGFGSVLRREVATQ